MTSLRATDEAHGCCACCAGPCGCERRSWSESEVLEEELKFIHGEAVLAGRPVDPPAFGPLPDRSEAPANPTNERERLRTLYRSIHSLTWPQTALCLSGGGIRSATFCLGVLQVLAARGLLARRGHGPRESGPDGIHYLSTVSGGGYIGSWLSAWLAREDPDVAIRQLGGPTRSGGLGATVEAGPVRRLREYSNWLAPRLGADIGTLSVLYLRNLLLNLLVLLPLVAALLLIPRAQLAVLRLVGRCESASAVALALAAVALAACVATIAISLPPCAGVKRPKWPIPPLACPWLLLVVAWLAMLAAMIGAIPRDPLSALLPAAMRIPVLIAGPAFLIGLLATSWWVGLRRFRWHHAARFLAGGAATVATLWIFTEHIVPGLADRPLLLLTLGIPSALAGYFVIGTGGAALTRSSEGKREWWAASGGGVLVLACAWLALHALVFYLTPLALKGGAYWASALAAVGGVSGILTAIAGYRAPQHASEEEGKQQRVLATLKRWALEIGALVFLVGGLGLGGSLAIAAALDYPQYASLLQKSSAADVAIERYGDAAKAVDRYVKRPPPAPQSAPATADAEATTTVEIAGGGRVAVTARGRGGATAVPAPSEADPELQEAARAARRRAAQSALDGVESWSGRARHAVDRWLRLGERSYWAGLLSSPACGCVPDGLIAVLPAGLMALALAVSACIGVNRFSLHGAYANRLVRAYLGASRPRGSEPPDDLTGFAAGDNLPMASLTSDRPRRPRGPFHVIGIALNLTQGARPEWAERKASSFTVTPLRAGSWMLGYRNVSAYGGDAPGGLSLGKAMAISGAAVNPNMGYHSSRLVAAVLTFFNVRLGWWLPNPGPAGAPVWNRAEPGLGLWPLMRELAGSAGESTRYVSLSDGGHFDNLGLYEMVRRRCARIIVVDAGADPDYRYDDLAMAVRRIRTDIGVDIEFPEDSGPSKQCAPEGSFVVGWIHYPQVDGEHARTGLLFYIKPKLSGREPVDVERYRREHRTGSDRFPHQSTGDLFFDESQFESYRMLGAHMAADMLDQVKRIESYVPRRKEAHRREDRQAPALGFSGMGTAPEPDRSGLGRLAQSIDQSSRQAAIAAPGSFWSWSTVPLVAGVLTVTGVVGVVGTLVMAPGTVRLDADALRVEMGPVSGTVTLTGNPKLDVGDGTIRFVPYWLPPAPPCLPVPWRCPEGAGMVIHGPVTFTHNQWTQTGVDVALDEIRAELAQMRPFTSAVMRLDNELWRLQSAVQSQRLRDQDSFAELRERVDEVDRALVGLRRFAEEELPGRLSREVGDRLGDKGELFRRIEELTRAIRALLPKGTELSRPDASR